MIIMVDHHSLPETGRVNLNLNQTFDITISAEAARRQVNRWLLNEVSYLLGAERPTLVIGDHIVWRVSPSKFLLLRA